MRFTNVRKIIIFKLCCLGDIVFMTPAIAALRKKFPGAEIYLVASSWVRKLTPYLKHVDKIIIYDPPLSGGVFNKLFGFIRLVRLLRRRRFDLAFLGHRASVFGFALKLSGTRYRLGFSGTKYLNYTADFDENVHETKRYLNVLTANGINADSVTTELNQKRKADDIKTEWRIPTDRFIIGIFPFGGINPGTKMDIKRWDYDRYINLIEMVANRFPEIIFVLFEGTEANEKVRDSKRSQTGVCEQEGVDFPDNVIVKSIDIDLISMCNIFIGGDTGPLHIAGAFGIPTLAIFGPSNPDLVMPMNGAGEISHKYIWKKPVCSPCYTPVTAIQRNNTKYWRDDNFICHVGTHVCMKDIQVEEVFGMLEEMVEKMKIK